MSSLSIQQVKSAHRTARALELRAQGLSHRAIASELGISQTHAHRLVRKAIHREVAIPARELGEKLVHSLSDEAIAMKGLLERLRTQINARQVEDKHFPGLITSIIRATESLERLVNRIAVIAGAEAPRQVDLHVEAVDPRAVRRALVAALVEEDPTIAQRVLGRFGAALGYASDQRSEVPALETIVIPCDEEEGTTDRDPTVTKEGGSDP